MTWKKITKKCGTRLKFEAKKIRWWSSSDTEDLGYCKKNHEARENHNHQFIEKNSY